MQVEPGLTPGVTEYEEEGKEGSTTYQHKEQAAPGINTTEVSQVNNEINNQSNQIKKPTTQKQVGICSNNIYTIISVIIIAIISMTCYKFMFPEPKYIVNSDTLHCPNVDDPIEITLTSKKKKLFAYNSHSKEHPMNTEYQWITKNDNNECQYISYGEETHTLTLLDFDGCKPFDINIQLVMSTIEHRFFSLKDARHSKTCDINLKFVYPPTEFLTNSDLFRCPNDSENLNEIQLTSAKKTISALHSQHPSDTKYKWTTQQHKNDTPCKCHITGYNTNELIITKFNECLPFEMKVKLVMNAMVNGYQIHSKECDMNLQYVYPPVEHVPNSALFGCPNTEEEILLTSSEKIITAQNSTHASNTIYQWQFADDISGCNYTVSGETTNKISISQFDDCVPFNIRMTLEFNATIKGYMQHTKSCPITLKFVYPPAQLINNSDILDCPDIENPLYSSLSTLNETICAKLSTHPTNTIYQWSKEHNGPECEYRLVGEHTNLLSILGVGAPPLCEPFKLDVILSMNTTTNPYTTHTKTCKINVIFHDNPVFGIDLGTTYSCISYQDNTRNAYYRRNTHMVVADKKLNNYCVRSAVYFTYDKQGNKQTLIGPDAINKINDDARNVFYDIKRIVGRSPNDEKFDSFRKTHDFVILNDNRSVKIPNWNETLLFEQVLSILLTHLVEYASNDWYNNKQGHNPLKYIQDVIVSAPALFHNGQRKGIRSACHLSGLNPIKLLIEPSAASIAHSYYLTVPDKRTSRFLAFDFGGGTLDCSVMRCSGVECTVLSVHGDSSLGGVDFDNVIYDIVRLKVKQQHGWTEISEKLSSRIRSMSEEIKIELTNVTEYIIALKDDKGSIKRVTITKDEFEQHPKTQALVQAAIDVAKHAIELAEFVVNDIKMILMIGGTSKIPIVQQSLENEFGKILVQSDDMDVQLMVGTGCGIIGGAIAYQSYSDILDVVLTDLLPLSIGYQDCVPTSKGDIDCKRMRKIIRKNTAYPTRETVQICQKKPDGNKLKLKLYEGDDTHVNNNYFLAEIEIDNIKPRDASVCDNVLLSFIVDENGIVHCEAETNPKYGNVKKYHIKIASENSKHGTIEKENVIKLSQNMKSWYNPKSFNLMRKLFDNDQQLSSLKLFDDE